MDKIVSLNFLRIVALAILLLSCFGSVWLVVNAGSHNDSALLRSLFATWVLSPFMALAITSVFSARWSFITRVVLYSIMIFTGLGSLVGYSGALSPPGAKPAAVFLVVPLISWLLMAIVIPLVAILSNKHEV